MSKALNLPALTTDQMIEVDRLMIDVWKISLIQMMENAGRNLAELARRHLGGSVKNRHATVFCGAGNNGGGGMVAARHLHNWGAKVELILVGSEDHLKNVPSRQWQIVHKMGLSVSKAQPNTTDIILDALIGYGLIGNPRPHIAEYIQIINASKKPILSLDAPSGLDTTTGTPASACVQATATLTLALPKTGLLTPNAKPFVGNLYLADISVPVELYAAPSLGLKVQSPFDGDSIVKIS